MQNKEQEVTDWLRSGMDYNEGISLLIAITQKQFYSTQFTGREQSLADKLAYEICKAAKVADHVTWKDFIREVQSVNCRDARRASCCEPETENQPTDFPDVKPHVFITNDENNPKICIPDSAEATETSETIAVVETIATKPLEEYPLVIRRVIMEYAELFQERSQLHTVMGRLPESNTDSVCAKRKELFDMIKTISDRLEMVQRCRLLYADPGFGLYAGSPDFPPR
jgi:hypothetical protein